MATALSKNMMFYMHTTELHKDYSGDKGISSLFGPYGPEEDTCDVE